MTETCEDGCPHKMRLGYGSYWICGRCGYRKSYMTREEKLLLEILEILKGTELEQRLNKSKEETK